MHRLALGLGRTVAELEVSLGQSELQDWMRYWMVEPWGAVRDNMHAGVIASAVLMPHTKKGKRLATFEDFMLTDPATRQEKRRAGTKATIAWLKAQAKRER